MFTKLYTIGWDIKDGPDAQTARNHAMELCGARPDPAIGDTYKGIDRPLAVCRLDNGDAVEVWILYSVHTFRSEETNYPCRGYLLKGSIEQWNRQEPVRCNVFDDLGRLSRLRLVAGYDGASVVDIDASLVRHLNEGVLV